MPGLETQADLGLELARAESALPLLPHLQSHSIYVRSEGWHLQLTSALFIRQRS